MGNTDSKCHYREALAELTGRSRPIDPSDEEFWSQFFYDNHLESINQVFTLLSPAEVRALRDETPLNLATLCYKAVEHLVHTTDTLCNTQQQQRTVLTCVALLTRILPFLFEDADWRRFFWSTPGAPNDSKLSPLPSLSPSGLEGQPLAHSLLFALTDLLFCPDFTVPDTLSKNTASGRFGGQPDSPPEDLQSIDSCEYIWAAGVGCSTAPAASALHEHNRTELLRLILTCLSESMYASTTEVGYHPNSWIELFTCSNNRHALPLFTSLLNTVFSYDPNSMIPFNHWLFSDSKEPLVEVALQILIVALDHDFSQAAMAANTAGQDDGDGNGEHRTMTTTMTASKAFRLSGESLPGLGGQDNLFILYISRIHREDDFDFLLKGFIRLLNNPIAQSYLPASGKRIQFHQELLVLFWKMCDYNKKFMFYALKMCDVLKILVPILYHLNDARADRSRVGLVHIGVFIILLLSGERNFGVRLNRPYQATTPMDLPIFSGTHADLLVIVFHKLITTGHQRLQPLFDCLLTILVNVSPYLKTLSMVASAKILHLLEAFSTPWFLFTNPTNHHLVFFLLEIFNNIIQYQFDGNANLVYTIIKKRAIFHQLANLPTDYGTIQRSLRLSLSKLTKSNKTFVTLSHHHRSQNPPRRSQTIGAFNSAASLRTAQEQHQQQSLERRSQRHKHPSTSSSAHQLDEASFPLPSRAMERRLCSSSSSGPSGLRKGDLDDQQKQPNINVTLPAMPKIASMTERMQALEDKDQSNQDEVNVDKEEDARVLEEGLESLMTDEAPASSRSSGLSRKGQTRRQQFTSGSFSCQSSSASEQTTASAGSSGVGHRSGTTTTAWQPTSEWILSWKQKLPLQTIMRMLQVLVPQVEKMCLDKGITDENEILRFLQHGTLVGLLPVPHPILIRKYQTNMGTTIWFRTYMWGVIYLRNSQPPIWYDTNVKLFEIQKS